MHADGLYSGRYRKAQELCAAVTSVVHAVDGAAFEVRVAYRHAFGLCS